MHNLKPLNVAWESYLLSMATADDGSDHLATARSELDVAVETLLACTPGAEGAGDIGTILVKAKASIIFQQRAQAPGTSAGFKKTQELNELLKQIDTVLAARSQ